MLLVFVWLGSAGHPQVAVVPGIVLGFLERKVRHGRQFIFIAAAVSAPTQNGTCNLHANDNK